MKKRTMTMEKLSKADEMVMTSLTKKQQDMERKSKMEKQRGMEAQMNKQKMLQD